MVCCDACDDWFHGIFSFFSAFLSLTLPSIPLISIYYLSEDCVNVPKEELNNSSYICPNCRGKGIQLVNIKKKEEKEKKPITK